MNFTVNVENDTMTITFEYSGLAYGKVVAVRRSDAGFEITNVDIEGSASNILRLTSSWLLEVSKTLDVEIV